MTDFMTSERLKNAVIRPSHAYILVGENILPQAKTFAKALQCEGRGTQEPNPCGACLSCRVFNSGNHPDVFFVKPLKTKAIGVEDVRTQIVLPMSEKPFRYKYKIFITDKELTPAAQNALLKTIEEPASFGMFIFLAEGLELFLPTVLSRAVTIKLGGSKVLAEPNEIEEMQKLASSTAAGVYGMDIAGVFGLYGQFEKWKESIQLLLDMLYKCYHDKLNMSENLQADLLSLEAISTAKKDLYHNGNFQMAIELMLLKMTGVRIWK